MSTALVGQQGQQGDVRFTVNLKAVAKLGEAFAHHGIARYTIPNGFAPFKEGARMLSLRNVIVPPEPRVKGETMLARGLALPGEAFGLLHLLSVVEKDEEIPVKLQGEVVLVSTDVLVGEGESGYRYVACACWRSGCRWWVVEVRWLNQDFGPDCLIGRFGE